VSKLRGGSGTGDAGGEAESGEGEVGRLPSPEATAKVSAWTDGGAVITRALTIIAAVDDDDDADGNGNGAFDFLPPCLRFLAHLQQPMSAAAPFVSRPPP
jgi:hypothetical protein